MQHRNLHAGARVIVVAWAAELRRGRAPIFAGSCRGMRWWHITTRNGRPIRVLAARLLNGHSHRHLRADQSSQLLATRVSQVRPCGLPGVAEWLEAMATDAKPILMGSLQCKCLQLLPLLAVGSKQYASSDTASCCPVCQIFAS
jgi:hypothetical protein